MHDSSHGMYEQGQFAAAGTCQGARRYGERGLPWGSGPRIAIEAYPGPMYVSHGTADPIWTVERSRRLVSARGGLVTESHFWPGEPHELVRFGPTARGEYERTLTDFFRRHLGP